MTPILLVEDSKFLSLASERTLAWPGVVVFVVTELVGKAAAASRDIEVFCTPGRS